MKYQVLAYTLVTDQYGDGWIEGQVWAGNSFITALREFRKAKSDNLGLYVSLRWNG